LFNIVLLFVQLNQLSDNNHFSNIWRILLILSVVTFGTQAEVFVGVPSMQFVYDEQVEIGFEFLLDTKTTRLHAAPVSCHLQKLLRNQYCERFNYFIHVLNQIEEEILRLIHSFSWFTKNKNRQLKYTHIASLAIDSGTLDSLKEIYKNTKEQLNVGNSYPDLNSATSSVLIQIVYRITKLNEISRLFSCCQSGSIEVLPVEFNEFKTILMSFLPTDKVMFQLIQNFGINELKCSLKENSILMTFNLPVSKDESLHHVYEFNNSHERSSFYMKEDESNYTRVVCNKKLCFKSHVFNASEVCTVSLESDSSRVIMTCPEDGSKIDAYILIIGSLSLALVGAMLLSFMFVLRKIQVLEQNFQYPLRNLRDANEDGSLRQYSLPSNNSPVLGSSIPSTTSTLRESST